ncbi:hypothetical protein [uncultured Sphingomonas sp.]|nr:hypothetical protein [uncultured Sphingomonas sp.]
MRVSLIGVEDLIVVAIGIDVPIPRNRRGQAVWKIIEEMKK